MVHATQKFADPFVTATGAPRASVRLSTLETLWFNTGTLCNLACDNCYIESSPRNDRLVYLTREDVRRFLEEARERDHPLEGIGFTGGEPFINPDIVRMIADSLGAGFRVLVLTNAMKPMQWLKTRLTAINAQFPGRLAVRVSLDHYERIGHDKLRSPRSWEPTIEGLQRNRASRFRGALSAAQLRCSPSANASWKDGQPRRPASASELGRSLSRPEAGCTPRRSSVSTKFPSLRPKRFSRTRSSRGTFRSSAAAPLARRWPRRTGAMAPRLPCCRGTLCLSRDDPKTSHATSP
ncbi:MAG: radical SAM protein [Afipia sp.]